MKELAISKGGNRKGSARLAFFVIATEVPVNPDNVRPVKSPRFIGLTDFKLTFIGNLIFGLGKIPKLIKRKARASWWF